MQLLSLEAVVDVHLRRLILTINKTSEHEGPFQAFYEP